MGNSTSAPPPVEIIGSSLRSSGNSSGNPPKISSSDAEPMSGDSGDPGYHIVPLKSGDESDINRSNTRRRQRGKNQRNTTSTSPFSSEGSTESVPIPSLHGSLMRVHQQRDPLRYYEIVKVLGDGSMGSVSKVQKRRSAQGGSARRKFVQREKHSKWCWGFFDPENCGRIFCPIDNEDEHRSFSSSLVLTNSEEKKGMGPIEEVSEHSEPSKEIKAPLNRSERVRQYATDKKSSSIITYERKDAFYALKSIHMERCKDDVFRQELMNEISILQRLDHPHIVKALETFDYKDRVYVILELCSGGDLYTRDPYSEVQACSIVHSILDAVAYMHARGITHRDLKFENIMFSSPNSDSVKVIDFGLSKKYSQEEHLHETVGTVYTMAPEVLKGDYDNKVSICLFIIALRVHLAHSNQIVCFSIV